MAIQKRKAVIRAAGKRGTTAGRGRKAAKFEANAAKKQKQLAEQQEAEEVEPEEEQEEGQEGEEQGEEEEEVVDEEQRVKEQEAELQTARKKELKALYLDELKAVATSKGVEPCKKDAMVEAIVAAEAKEREDARAQQAKLRAVVLEKKEELEALPMPELREVCTEYGIKGQLTKQARVEQILKLWQEADGVDRALAKRARDERAAALEGMEKPTLQKLCEAAGVEPFVPQVMVERLVRAEDALGKFARPTVPAMPCEEDQDKEEKPKRGKKADMVDVLLENEARRKREAELKKQQEEAEASKRKELKAMSVEELKQSLAKRGQEAAGKKDDMVNALYQLLVREEAAAARKAKLLALHLDQLKSLVTSRGLATGKKEEMVDALFKQQAQATEAVRAYDAKIEEALAKVKEDLETKTAAELKDMCAAKGLKLGAGKEQRVETLLEHSKDSGALAQVVAAMAKAARSAELLAKDQAELLRLCEAAGADPLVKEVLVERLLAHEAECGGSVELAEEPESKRPRRR